MRPRRADVIDLRPALMSEHDGLTQRDAEIADQAAAGARLPWFAVRLAYSL